MAPEPSARLVVGIDFGTTFSGVAYAFVKGDLPPADIKVVTGWRGILSFSKYDRVKVPTKIWYNPTGEIVWGYQVPDDADSVEWFKLLLIEESDLSEKLQKSENTTIPRGKLAILGKDVTTVVGDYLTQLWQFALKGMRAEHGTMIDAIPLTVVLTVPAIWPEYARKRMLEAAEFAGICKDRASAKTVVSLVSEPEAAAIATITTVFSGHPEVKPGDLTTVIDIGGGTADVISYIVDEIDPLPKFREIVEGDGSFHGAKLVDQAFEDYIKTYIGLKKWETYGKFHSRILEESWQQSIKPSFDNVDRPWAVDTIVDGLCYLSKEQVAACFDNSVTPGIKGLVKSQIKLIKKKTGTLPKFVILVGGFGRCPYIRKVLQEGVCQDNGIQILQASSDVPWSCVCRGAVQYGAGIQPTARTARYSYGWSTDEPFDPEKHRVEDRFWNEILAKYMARNQVHWPIRRGQEVKTNKNIHSYSLTFKSESMGYYTHKARFYKSRLQDPPERIGEEDGLAELGVRPLGHIELKTPVRIEDLPKTTTSRGKALPILEWDWEIRVSGGSVEMIATTPDGEKVAELNIGDITN